MKPNSFLFAKRGLLAVLLAGGGLLAATAFAVSGGAEGCDRAGKPAAERHGQRHEGGFAAMREQFDARRDEQLTTLKEKLKLEAGQHKAWEAYVAASQPRMTPEVRESMMSSMDALTTPERVARMEALARARQAHMQAYFEAVKAFYAQLSPEQRRVFDVGALPGFLGHGHTRGHRHMS